MTEIKEGGYILRQANYTRITHVIAPDGSSQTVIGPKLTAENAKKIIIALGADFTCDAPEL